MVTMDIQSQQIMSSYAEAYQLLYKRQPKELRLLENGWVSVNGARMRATELQFLTDQLHKEYRRDLMQRRNVVQRLLNWFKQ